MLTRGQYTPKNEFSDTEKEIWKLVHGKEKFIFSKTEKWTDNKVTIIDDNIVEEVIN